MNCEFCGSPGAERIQVQAQYAKGLPLNPGRARACAGCTPQGFTRAMSVLTDQLPDLKRRRAILELNRELAQLQAQEGSAARDAQIAENRARKTALVQLQGKNVDALKAVLEGL